MSGAEALAVLGAISAALTIIQNSKAVYQAAKDARGLHEAFKKVADSVPLVQETLQQAEQAFQAGGQDPTEQEATAKAARPVVTTVEERLGQLREIFEKVVPGDDAGRRERYRKALESVMPGKKRRVEELMKDVLEQLQLLHTNQFFKDSVRSQKLQQALEGIVAVPPSLPDEDGPGRYAHTGSGSMNVNAGTGTQNNYSASGNSKQYNAHTMRFGRDD